MKKGSLNVSRVPRFSKGHFSTIYRVIDYYSHPNDVDYINRHNAHRTRALDCTQIKQLDQTIWQNQAATATELL